MGIKFRFSKPVQVIVGISVGLMALLGVAYCLTDIPSAVLQYKSNQERAVKAGLFLDTPSYLKTLEVPAAENGAGLMQKAIDAYEARAKGVKFEDTASKSLNKAEIVTAYADLEQAWKKVDEASTKKFVIFPRKREPLSATLFPDFAKFKMMVKLAAWRATIASENNDLSTAKLAWLRAANMSLMADDEPVLISMLVRIACESIVEDSIRKALSVHAGDPLWRNAALEALTRLDQPLDFRAALTVEHRFASEGFDLLKSNDSFFGMDDWNKSAEGRTVIAFSKLPNARKANDSRINECYSEYVTRLGQDPWDAQKMISASAWMDTYINGKTGISYCLAKILMPVFSEAGRAIAKSYAQRNVLMQAIKLLENPNQKDLPLKGRYALDSDGKPLRLVWDKNRRIVYSIGPNFKDDGGIIERPKGSGSMDYDYGIAIPK